MAIKILQPECFTKKGQKPNQEDTLFPLEGGATTDTRVFLVCDGMGGHENGEVASGCVAETVGKLTSALPLCSTAEMRTAFESAIAEAYNNLDALDKSTSIKKMGTTLTFVALCTDGVLVAHIGDSRVYLFRPNEGIVFQTRDHSLVNDLIAAGELTEEEARNHPQRNVITRALQPHMEYRSKATYKVLTDIRKGDILFLCCDGVTEQLDNEDLCRLLLNDTPLKQRTDAIMAECANRNTRDNNSCYAIEIADVALAKAEDGLKTNEEGLKNKNEGGRNKEEAIRTNAQKKSSSKLWIIIAAIIALIAAGLVFLTSPRPSQGGGTQAPNAQTTTSPAPVPDGSPSVSTTTEAPVPYDSSSVSSNIQGPIKRHK